MAPTKVKVAVCEQQNHPLVGSYLINKAYDNDTYFKFIKFSFRMKVSTLYSFLVTELMSQLASRTRQMRERLQLHNPCNIDRGARIDPLGLATTIGD